MYLTIHSVKIILSWVASYSILYANFTHEYEALQYCSSTTLAGSSSLSKHNIFTCGFPNHRYFVHDEVISLYMCIIL